MPGGNMTFGASLRNTKMMEAIMDLKTGSDGTELDSAKHKDA